MYPLINISGFEIQTYSIIAAIGFAVTAVVAVYLGKLRKIPSDKSLAATVLAGLGILAGGHLLFALTNIKSIYKLVSGGEFSFSALTPYISGMVYYGGFFGAIIAVLIYSRASKDIIKKDLLDVFAVSVPLFHSFGRVGCFFAGCCYGVESDFGITTYLNSSATHYGVSRFPVALIEAIVNLLIFILLLCFFKRNKFCGKLIFAYLFIYAPLRFILEFFRADTIRGFVFGLSTSQFISLLIFFFLIIYFAVNIKKKSSETD